MTLNNLLELWKNCHISEHEKSLFEQFVQKKEGKRNLKAWGNLKEI